MQEQPQHQISKDPVADKVQQLTSQVNAIENLAEALKSPQGQLILRELRAQHDILVRSLESVALQKLTPPFFEYSKEDLQKSKAYRAQLFYMEELLDRLDPDKLDQKITVTRQEIQEVAAGEPLSPAYN